MLSAATRSDPFIRGTVVFRLAVSFVLRLYSDRGRPVDSVTGDHSQSASSIDDWFGKVANYC